MSAEQYPGDEAGDSTHAAVRIQHVVGSEGTTRGDALAGFVRVPAGAEPEEVLALSGLRVHVPPKGECFTEAELAKSLTTVRDAELLEAESVRLETDGGTHELAPYAFPTVADLLRGVVYLSRDRTAEALPADSTYTLFGSGIASGEDAVEVTATEMSPPELSGVVVGGQEFSGSMLLPPARVLDLTWMPSSAASDLVVVGLQSESRSWTCTFADSEGFGSVPLVTDSGHEFGQDERSAVLTIHRLRTKMETGTMDVVQVTVTFDFAVEAEIFFDADAEQLPARDDETEQTP